METHVVFCSACDREVRVVFGRDGAAADAAGAEVDPSGVCLDHGTTVCTGSSCALFDLPPQEMLVRLQRSGLAEEA
jgi:hypothetical protein